MKKMVQQLVLELVLELEVQVQEGMKMQVEPQWTGEEEVQEKMEEESFLLMISNN